MRAGATDGRFQSAGTAPEIEIVGRPGSGHLHLHFDRRERAWRTHDEMVQARLIDDGGVLMLAGEGDVT
ncbi:MAG TPA: hypothetical protein VFO60_05120 [Candidatus Dormibacteraeota bacterium]|nr:hypothetical protein [Candidatus Dormibacteraeota bacterium]